MDVAQFRGIRSTLNSSLMDGSFEPSFTIWCGAYFCNGHLDQILQVIFSTLESYTRDNVDPSSGCFSGYTEVNLGLCSGHLQWTMVVQTCEKYPTKMARENHIVQSDFTLMVKSVIPS